MPPRRSRGWMTPRALAPPQRIRPPSACQGAAAPQDPAKGGERSQAGPGHRQKTGGGKAGNSPGPAAGPALPTSQAGPTGTPSARAAPLLPQAQEGNRSTQRVLPAPPGSTHRVPSTDAPCLGFPMSFRGPQAPTGQVSPARLGPTGAATSQTTSPLPDPGGAAGPGRGSRRSFLISGRQITPPLPPHLARGGASKQTFAWAQLRAAKNTAGCGGTPASRRPCRASLAPRQRPAGKWLSQPRREVGNASRALEHPSRPTTIPTPALG